MLRSLIRFMLHFYFPNMLGSQHIAHHHMRYNICYFIWFFFLFGFLLNTYTTVPTLFYLSICVLCVCVCVGFWIWPHWLIIIGPKSRWHFSLWIRCSFLVNWFDCPFSLKLIHDDVDVCHYFDSSTETVARNLVSADSPFVGRQMRWPNLV